MVLLTLYIRLRAIQKALHYALLMSLQITTLTFYLAIKKNSGVIRLIIPPGHMAKLKFTRKITLPL
ncbi:hypothetical protein P348_00315 [Enterobacter sp. DC3]|nr:hypothetical protein P349_01398 [Enterobacter sp. DC4]EWG76596.1 hypothetical protein P348_00315 [Enterobacter sp. DC3]